VTDPFLNLAEENIARLNRERDQRQTAEWRAGNRLWKIMMLAPTIEIAEALLRGDPVPINRLDPVWVERFGLRQPEAA
jgi:hypothetical protein